MWIYQGQEFTEAGDWYGFVYEITNITNNRKYIGMKFFTAASRKQVKGKIKKIRIESDWKTYYGSSKELQADIDAIGKENFHREILRLCEARGETKYWELKLQVLNNVLEERFANGDFVYYNSNLSMKHTRRSIGKRTLNEQNSTTRAPDS
jgi:hypothetical protein